MPTAATAALQVSNGRRGRVMIPDSFMYGLDWTNKSEKTFDDCAWTKTRTKTKRTVGIEGSNEVVSQRPARVLTATQSNEMFTQIQGQILAGSFRGGGWSAKPLRAVKTSPEVPPPAARERPPTNKEVTIALKTLQMYMDATERGRQGASSAVSTKRETERSSASTQRSQSATRQRKDSGSVPRRRPESAQGTVTVSESGDSMVLSLEKGWTIEETAPKPSTRWNLPPLEAGKPGKHVRTQEGRLLAGASRAATSHNASPGRATRTAKTTDRTKATAITGRTSMLRSAHGVDPDPLMDELFHRLETRKRVEKERALHRRSQSRARAVTSLGFTEMVHAWDDVSDFAPAMSRLRAAVPSLDLRNLCNVR